MFERRAALLFLLAAACQDPSVLVPSDRDAGNFRDGGLDAGVPECWTLSHFQPSDDETRQLGRRLATEGDHVFAVSYLLADGDIPSSWQLSRLTSHGGAWAIDRSLRGRDVGREGLLIDALALGEQELWLGLPGAPGGGAVHRVSLDLELIGPAVGTSTRTAEFGFALATSGPWLFVGDPGVDRRGVVHVYSLETGMPIWKERLRSPSPLRDERFGEAIVLRGDRLLVGAPTLCGDGECPERGRVYPYRLSGGRWQAEAPVEPTDDFTRGFGRRIAWLDDDTAWIGAPQTYHCVERCFATSSSPTPPPGSHGCPSTLSPCRFVGAAYEWSGSDLVARLPSELGTEDNYGLRWSAVVAASPSWLAVGAAHDPSCSYRTPLSYGCSAAGSVHLFVNRGGERTKHRYLRPDDLQDGALYGEAIVLRDRRLVIGAPGHCGELPDDGCSGTGFGAVYVYDGCEAP